MSFRQVICRVLSAFAMLHARAGADDAFERQVAPFLKTYCFECHNERKHQAELDLTRYSSAASVGRRPELGRKTVPGPRRVSGRHVAIANPRTSGAGDAGRRA